MAPPRAVREASQHDRRMRRAGIDERLHIRECVEEEMRRDLRLQQMQSRVERLALEFTALERERQRLVAREGLLWRTTVATAVQGAMRTAANPTSIQLWSSKKGGALGR